MGLGSQDPGSSWKRDGIALESDRPEDAARILTPCVIALPDRTLRMLYMGHGPASPPGTRGRILSARSEDGVRWRKEPGVRIDCEGLEDRTLSPDVIAADGGWRVYFESSIKAVTSLASAFSRDALTFEREPGLRVEIEGTSVGSPRALMLGDGRVRLYFHVYREPFVMGLDRGNHVESSISRDGLSFVREEGIRIAQTLAGVEDEAAYCARMIALERGRVRTYYSAWNGAKLGRGAILTALSDDDGLSFTKNDVPCIRPDGEHDGGFASDPCVFRAPDGSWRMVYEAADVSGTTRILSAVAAR